MAHSNPLQTIRSTERGHANHGWLDSHHSFSFADYHNPSAMGFSHLRVINEDRVSPGAGFGTHSHQNMEIISYVLHGELEHKDSMGTGSVIRPGDVQLMSAGTGVRHSEFNASQTDLVHFLQIWIVPNKTGGAPRYEQKRFSDEDRLGRLVPVVTPTGSAGSLSIKQDMQLFSSMLAPEKGVTHTPAQGRKTYVHVAKGSLSLNGQYYTAGDGIGLLTNEPLTFATDGSAEFLLFDLKN